MALAANLPGQAFVGCTGMYWRALSFNPSTLRKTSCHFAESNGIETRKAAFTFGSSQQILCAKREPGMSIKSCRNAEGTENVYLASWQQQGSI